MLRTVQNLETTGSGPDPDVQHCYGRGVHVRVECLSIERQGGNMNVCLTKWGERERERKMGGGGL